jgi:hypothetical protein
VKVAGAPVSVVEVGGGYGGLAHAISFLASRLGVQIASYAIVDLEPVAQLQRLYLEKVGLNFPFQTYSSAQYGADVPGEGLFLISNYCFSEIQRHHQDAYRAALFPKVAAGFLTWNNIPLYDLGRAVQSEPEDPKTGPLNLYVRF